MVTTTLTLPRYRHLNFLLQYCLELTNETNMSQALLHHNGNSLRAPFPTLINRILQHFHRNTIPPNTLATRADILLQREVAVQFQVEGVELANFGMCCLVDDLSRDVELGTLRVKIQVLDADFESKVDTC